MNELNRLQCEIIFGGFVAKAISSLTINLLDFYLVKAGPVKDRSN